MHKKNHAKSPLGKNKKKQFVVVVVVVVLVVVVALVSHKLAMTSYTSSVLMKEALYKKTPLVP